MSFNPKHYSDKPEEYLPQEVDFTIFHIDDINKSKQTKLEEWQEFQDPNNVAVDRINKGNNRIIREVNLDDTSDSGPKPDGPRGPCYKLTLKDSKDNYCFAYEYNDRLGFLRSHQTNTPIPIMLGGKLRVHKNTLIAHGALLLNRAQCHYLGVDESSQLVKDLNANISEKYIKVLQT